MKTSFLSLDVSRCQGGECIKKNSCKRYLSTLEDQKHSDRIVPMMLPPKTSGGCEYRIPVEDN